MPTTQQSPSRHQEHFGQRDDGVSEHIPVTVETALSEPTNVSAHQAHEVAQDPESSQNSSRQGENTTYASHVVEGNGTGTSENAAEYFAGVPASVQVIDEDTAHTERAAHSPLYDHDVLGSTSSPNFHTETQTLTVSVIDGNHSQTTHAPYRTPTLEHLMTDFPVEMITRHELNESVDVMISRSPESLTPHELEHDHSNSETSANLPNVLMPSEERHTEAGTVVTAGSPVEHHTAVSVGAEPTDFPFGTEKNMGNKSEIAGPIGNSAEGPVFISHGTKMKNEMEMNSSESDVMDVPTVMPVRIIHAADANRSDVVMTGHANMLVPSADNGGHDETATVVPERHKHDGVLSNDLYFPDPEHAENDTLLNALSPEDYDSHPLQPVTVVSRTADNSTAVPDPNLKKGPRLDDDEMFQVNPNEENNREVTSEATVENISVALSSVNPVTERYSEEAHVSDTERLPSPSDNTSHPDISAGEVHELGTVTVETIEHHWQTSVADDARDVLENATEPVTRQTALKSDEHDLSAVLKGTGSQVTTDNVLAVSATEDASEHIVEVPVITTESVDVSGTEVAVIRPEEVPTDSTATGADTATALRPESVTSPDSSSTSPIVVHDSSISSDRDASSPSRENVIEDGDSLHRAVFNTTEAEVDHPLTVAPLREHVDGDDGELHKALAESEQSTEMTARAESANVTAESVPDDAENSTASPVTQPVIQTLTAKNLLSPSGESDNMTTGIAHEENDISSGGEQNSHREETDIATGAIPDATQPENEVVVNVVQNVTRNGETKLAPLSSDSETTDLADRTDEEEMRRNVTVGRQTDSPLRVSSGEQASQTTFPQDMRMNQTEKTVSTARTTTEMPLESDNEAEDTGNVLGKPLPQDSSSGSVLGTPLPQNSSSGSVLFMPLPQDSSSGSVLGTPLPQNSSSGSVLGKPLPQNSSSGSVLGTQLPQNSSSGSVLGKRRRPHV
jgi:hypothetical protein